jgi:hypothetical protein
LRYCRPKSKVHLGDELVLLRHLFPPFLHHLGRFTNNPIAHVVCITLSVRQIHVSTCNGPSFLLSVKTMSNSRTGGGVMVNVAKTNGALRRGGSGYKKVKVEKCKQLSSKHTVYT